MELTMKILFFQWHSFMAKGMEKALTKMGIEYDVFFYLYKDWEKDDKLAEMLEDALKTKVYFLLLSVNYSPVLSEVCEQQKIPYIAWIYDSPMHIRNLSGLNNSYTHAFLFDRGMVDTYRRQGFQIEHMPLAVDETDFAEALQRKDTEQYEVTLLGKLYQTEYSQYTSVLPEYLKGYLNGVLATQGKLYGAYMLGDILTKELMEKINISYRKETKGEFEIEKRELEYMMGCEVTCRERYMLLRLLAKHFPVELYSSDEKYPEGVRFHGYADYYTEMPWIFHNSRINLNVSLKAIRTGIPLRVLDIMGCGGFVLANYQEEIAEHFRSGWECVMYESIEDAFMKVKYYLAHEDERAKIAHNGLEKVRRDFTYEDRLSRMLKLVKE